MTELDGLDGLERLDPALRAIATERTDFSLNSIQLMREPFNQRRREAAEHTDVQGVRIVEDTVVAESGSVAVRIYSGGEADPAPALVYCHAGGFVLGNLDTEARQLGFYICKLTRQRKTEAFPSLEATRQYVDALDSVFAHSQRHARTHKAVPGSAVEHKIDVSGDCDALFAANFERIETHRSRNGGYALRIFLEPQ